MNSTTAQRKSNRKFDENRYSIWHFCQIRGCGARVFSDRPYCDEHTESEKGGEE